MTAVFQLVVAIASGQSEPFNPLAYWSFVGFFGVESVVVTALLVRSASPAQRRLAVLDVAAMNVLLLGQLTYSDPATRFSTWDAWGYGVAVSTPFFVGMGFRRWRSVLTATASMSGCYLFAVAPAAFAQHHFATVVTNATSFVTNGVLVRLLWLFAVRLAGEAEAARRLAARIGERAERDRHRLLLHDHLSLLDRLARPVPLDESLRSVLQQQAASAMSRTRTFLLQPETPVLPGSLGAVLYDTAAEFGDLPLTVTVDLVDDLIIAPEVANVVEHAVRTLLHNVRNHARTVSAVVVHGDQENAEGGTSVRWEVTVSDDGVGFAAEGAKLGFGLRRQVMEALGGIGGAASIASEPGQGTFVTLTGPQYLKPGGTR